MRLDFDRDEPGKSGILAVEYAPQFFYSEDGQRGAARLLNDRVQVSTLVPRRVQERAIALAYRQVYASR